MMPKADKRLRDALAERDRAIQELASVRVELNAIKLKLNWPNEPNPPQYPDSADPGSPPPLRYVLVDVVYSQAKGFLNPLRSLLKKNDK
jgi:hypothetical protein